MNNPPSFSLIIPAHNEEEVISRCLKTATRGAPRPFSFEIIVAANGCVDRTAQIAQSVCPEAIVLNLPAGSKTAAINAANAIATYPNRIFLDADVECSYRSLSAIAYTLAEPGVMTAAPAIRLELSHSNRWVASYYRAWMKQPYAVAGKGGAGCYGLSEAALKQAGKFPPIVGDDIWIHTRFPDEVKRFVSEDAQGEAVFSTVRPPKTAREQISVETRRLLGNAQVKRDYPSPYFGLSKKGGGVMGTIRSGAAISDLAVFYVVKLLVRVQMLRSRISGETTSWTRDLSSRQG